MNADERFVLDIPPLPHRTQAIVMHRGRSVLQMTAEAHAWLDDAVMTAQRNRIRPAQSWQIRWISLAVTFYTRDTLLFRVDSMVRLVVQAIEVAMHFDARYVFQVVANKQEWDGEREVVEVVVSEGEVI